MEGKNNAETQRRRDAESAEGRTKPLMQMQKAVECEKERRQNSKFEVTHNKSPGTANFALRMSNFERYFLAAPALEAASAYFLVKRSTRPAVSTSFCLPVKNG